MENVKNKVYQTYIVFTKTNKKNLTPLVCFLAKMLPIHVSATMRIFFQSGLLEKDFYEYLHIIVAERAHKMFFNHELGTESENNLKIGHVTWGHRYLKCCLKCSQISFFKLAPLFFHVS